MGVFHMIVQGTHDPQWHFHLLHPVPECPDVLPLLEDHYIFQGEEDIMKIKAKDILVNKLSESIGTLLSDATYSIFKGYVCCYLTSNSR